MNKKVREIIIEYEDGTREQISAFQLDRLERLQNAVNMLERARALFQALKPLFGAKKT